MKNFKNLLTKIYLVFMICFFFVVSGFTAYGQSNDKANRIIDTSNPQFVAPTQIVASKNGPSITLQSISPNFQFDEFPVNHNLHITSDGNYYYTINGGNFATGQINQFDLCGNLIQTFPIQIDGRGLSYNKPDSSLYASLYTGDIVRIDSLAAGTFTTIFTGIMHDAQASFAISPDGKKFYDFMDGTLYIHDFLTGAITDTLFGLSYGPGNFGGNCAVAVDTNYIYTWDATIKTVSMYDMLGSLVQTMVLDSGENGISLSLIDGHLFVSHDGNYSIGTWYGYGVFSLCTNPIAHLTSSDSAFCEKQCIDFFDQSTNFPTSWQWNFPGATPDTSTLQNPVNICYNNPGNYDVSLVVCNALGCDSITFAGLIQVDSLPVIYLGNDTVICINDSIILNAGSGFSSYLWNNGLTTQSITVSVAGGYAVEVSSGNCSVSDTITISTQTCAFLPVASLTSSDTSFCEKQFIDFYDQSTNSPTSWQWLFNGGTPGTSTLQNPVGIFYNSYGSFDVTLIACNTVGCDTIFLPGFINEFANPPVPVITWSSDTLYSTSATTYQWYFNSSLIPGATSQYYVFQQPGDYFVIVTDSNGCAVSSANLYTEVNEIGNASGGIYVVPNPTDGDFVLVGTKVNSVVKICDAAGRMLYLDKIRSSAAQVHFVAADGIYFIEIFTTDKIIRKKIVLEK